MIELAKDIVDNESLRVTIHTTKGIITLQTEKNMLLDVGLTLANKKRYN